MVTTEALKIVYIGQKGLPARWGGVERATEELAVRMANAGYNVTAYCRRWYTENQPATFKGISLIYLPTVRTKHFDAITHSFISVVHALWNRADVIHFQGIGPALLAWIPRIFSPRTRVLVTFHCLDRKLAKWNRFARACFWLGEFFTMKCAHEIFVTSRFLQDYTYQVWERSATYLPNGVFGTHDFDASPLYIKPFCLRPQEYIVCVGRFMHDKAQHEVMEAFIRFKAKAGLDYAHIKLVFVGDTAFDTEYRTQLKKRVGARHDIVFTGVQTGVHLRSLMRFALCAMQPSHSEGMPIAVLELAAHAVPLVLSDIPAHHEIFGDAYEYTDVGSIEQLTFHLEKIVYNEQHARAIARIESLRILEQYRWEVTAARYNVSLVSITAAPSVTAQAVA